MRDTVPPEFRAVIADRIEASDRLLASNWLDGLRQLVPVALDEIFPGEQLLGHAPTLIRELAGFLRAPAHDTFAANAVVTARATELGRVRHAQRASVHQVLREYRTLRTVIAHFIQQEIANRRLAPQADEVIEVMNRLEAAVDVLLQTAVNTFVREYTDAIARHASQLEGFNRMVTHELRQPLGTLQFALKRLTIGDTWSDPAKRGQILDTADRNLTRINDTLAKLFTLSRSDETAETPLVRRVDISSLTTDIISQLREVAEARGVELRIGSPLPTLTIDVARLELVLVNLFSNGIKYSDPQKAHRFVEIAAADTGRPHACTLAIRDNGVGVAETELRSIFARFYRGHAAARDHELGTSGLGLGLAIVADCVDAIDGDIRVESQVNQGTTFLLELPTRAET